ncbi:MAG: sugar transferase, partial [Oscillospiraceae bacterium]|nr:sugar transferase [Oscillospiraceae bacterium]
MKKPKDRIYAGYIKRILDLLISIPAFIILLPLMIVLLITGFAAMKGNPLFIQPRPGKKDKNGQEKTIVSFDNKKQRVVQNDIFADPNDNLLALSGNGKFLAVSFEDGGLMVYDTTDKDNSAEIYDQSDFNHFEGGFYDKFFAFSSTKDGSSVFAVINMDKMEQEGGFELDSRIGVQPDETGIYISHK